jgi:hypothetical protein
MTYCLIILLFCAGWTPCNACAAIGPQPINIASESAAIVWNGSTHTEHFIRTATFDTANKDFGFIVPTPTTPVLRAVDESSLHLLNGILQPTLTGDVTEVVPVSMWYWYAAKDKLGYVMFMGSAVDVTARQHVNGVDATTLAAQNIIALKAWMKGNGYSWSREIADWLQPYVDKKWQITVFKFARSTSGKSKVASNLLDMTFQADAPFYPYSEPASNRVNGHFDPARHLRVFVLSDTSVDASLAPNNDNAVWEGNTTYTAPLDAGNLRELAARLKLSRTELPGAKPWLTVFDDGDGFSPRPGYADLYFPASSQDTKRIPPPIDHRIKHVIYLPIDAFAAIVLVGFYIFLRKLQRAGKIVRFERLYTLAAIVLWWAMYFAAISFSSPYYQAWIDQS